jgi:hypothetical protein
VALRNITTIAAHSTPVSLPRALADLADCLAAYPEAGRSLVAFVAHA